jgi:hypothetical protein
VEDVIYLILALQDPDYERDLRPLVVSHCALCHGERKQKAELNLETYKDHAAVLKARPAWTKVYQMVSRGEMPPAKATPLSPEERRRMLEWLENAFGALDARGTRDPGRVVLRRLNRFEYKNTIRDLLGVEASVDDFPLDDIGYGFDNIGDVLSLPPLLLEKYLAAAEKILDKAIVTDLGREPTTRRLELKEVEGARLNNERLVFFSNGDFGEEVEIRHAGTYVVKVRASADQAGPETAKMAIRIDREEKIVEVKGSRDKSQTYEARMKLEPGRRRVGAAFINDYYRPKDPDPKNRDRNLHVWSVELSGPYDAPPPELPESHKRIFFSNQPREILSAFLLRAFRRPPRPEEIDRYAKLVRPEALEAGIKLALTAALVSPHFLFRVETFDGVRELNDFELATRLSYFLWSSMPDRELLDLAAQGRLKGALQDQARRMLKDPKASALSRHFAVQWLQIRRLDSAAPDKAAFPSFDEDLRRAMTLEAEMFFDSVVREDLSLLTLLDADYSFVNERLARHYGIEGVRGPEMRRVKVAAPRGGVLTMAAVLTSTSTPTRTSPVLRGKWVLESILGVPPPPPVPDAGTLKEEVKGVTVRQRLEEHRANPACAACHAKMDPLGFGLENFDGIGIWREKDEGRPIDVSATLPDGSSFAGPVELKKLLLSRKEEFVRCLTEKMLIYALGRGVEIFDGPTLRAVESALAADGHRFSTLVIEVVKSYPFRYGRR